MFSSCPLLSKLVYFLYLCVVLINYIYFLFYFFFFSSRRRHTRYIGDWSSDVCSSDLSAMNETINDSFLRELDLKGGECILDVGSGLGQFSRAMARAAKGCKVLGKIGRASCRERV